MSGLLGRVGRVLGSPVAVGGAAVVLAAVGLHFAFFGGGVDHVVTVDFADADGLVTGNEVRIAGVQAGGVGTIQIVHNADPRTNQNVVQLARVTLHIDDAHWPLHQGTQFAVRPRGVLSNVFVALEPGPMAAPLVDVSHIVPVTETSSPVNLDELSNVFDPSVRDAIKTQIDQGNVALGGQGSQNGAANLNGLLQTLNPLTRDLTPLTAVLAARSPELDRLNTEFNTIVTELAAEDQNLRGVIEHGSTLFAAVAAQQANLKGTLDHAASVLTTLDSALVGEEPNLIAFFQKSPAVLDGTKQANDLLLPLVTQVNPHIPDLNILLHYFVTGNGFMAGTPPTDTLRVDASLPLQGRSATACGGDPALQPHCASNPQPAAATDGPSGSATQVAATPLLGGLLG